MCVSVCGLCFRKFFRCKGLCHLIYKFKSGNPLRKKDPQKVFGSDRDVEFEKNRHGNISNNNTSLR